MRKSKAISIIDNLIKELNNLPLDGEHNNWITKTTTYLTKFFGKESYQSNNFKYRSGYLFKTETKKEINDFLLDCKEIISNNGLYKEPKKNILSTIPDGFIIPIITALLFIGGILGRYQKDIAFIRLEDEIEKLQDSISIISTNKITNKSEKINNNPNNN